jgi:glyoxylase I family protein
VTVAGEAVTGIHHLGLTVRDVEASARWYSTVLGFARVGEYISPDHSRRKIFLGHSRLDVRIGLCEHARSGDDTFDETRPGLDHLAFAVGGIDELRKYEELLQSLGVVYTPATPANTLEGARVLVFRDPDNIQLELIAPPSDVALEE